jgi:hypothetical protein
MRAPIGYRGRAAARDFQVAERSPGLDKKQKIIRARPQRGGVK